MSRTITALFDSRADADAAKNRLNAADIDISGLTVADQSTQGYSATDYSTSENKGMWASIKGAFLPDEDRHHYEEGVRRGGFLLSGEVDDDEADEAVRILDDASSVDIEGRASDWKSKGWDYQAPVAAAATGTAHGATPKTGMTDRAMSTDGEQRIPIVEETLKVGKREINRGGVRVRSYVTETPVREDITLRDETVSVDRRKVDLPLSAADGDAFRERTIEMTETAEEAVVSKDARVVEEVVVRKDVGSRTETVSDTVRRTDVEIDKDADLDGSLRSTSSAYRDGADKTTGGTVAGLANEAVGNVKQGLGSLTGNDSLKDSGAAQERKGEGQQGEQGKKGY